MNYLDYRKRLGIGFDNSQLASLFLKKNEEPFGDHMRRCII